MSLYQRIKKRVHEIIGPTEHGDIPSLIYDVVLCLLVVLSSAAVILELVGIGEPYATWLETFEYVTVGIFIAEYVVRVWVAEFEYPECKNKFAAILFNIGLRIVIPIILVGVLIIGLTT